MDVDAWKMLNTDAHAYFMHVALSRQMANTTAHVYFAHVALLVYVFNIYILGMILRLF